MPETQETPLPWVRKIPGEGNGNPLQYFLLENSMDRGAWQVTVHGIAKSWTWQSTRLHVYVNTLNTIQLKFNCTNSSLCSVYSIIYQWKKWWPIWDEHLHCSNSYLVPPSTKASLCSTSPVWGSIQGKGCLSPSPLIPNPLPGSSVIGFSVTGFWWSARSVS